jgi:hypothetical protein
MTYFSFTSIENIFRHLQLSSCGAPSLVREWACNLFLQLFLGFGSAVTLRPVSHRPHDHNLLSHMRLSKPGEAVPHICIPRNRVAQLYPWALGSLFIASYDMQGYSGGVLNHLNMGYFLSHRNKISASWPASIIK